MLGAPRLVAEKLSSLRSFDSQFGIFDCFDGYFSKFKTQKKTHNPKDQIPKNPWNEKRREAIAN